jgi:hypothetical protein
MFEAEKAFPIYMGVLLILGIFGGKFFLSKRSVVLKGKVWPIYVVAIAVLIMGYMLLIGFPVISYILMAPAVVVLVVFALRSVKFCGNCGKVALGKRFKPPKYCNKCNEKLVLEGENHEKQENPD